MFNRIKKEITIKLIRYENLKNRIIEIRGQKVLLDSDVAEIYAVETKRINEAVSRNPCFRKVAN